MTRLMRVGRAVGLVVVGLVAALVGLGAYNQYLAYRQMMQTQREVVLLINYNLQAGTLKLPPQMQPQAPAGAGRPSGPPSPSPAPDLTK